MKTPTSPRRGQDIRSRGQILVIFTMSIFMFIGMCGLVLDVAWYWANTLRVQRAGDAAALAGVVYLPGDEPSAITAARAEASMNGFTNGLSNVVVTAGKDPDNPRSLQVTVSGSVGTFFMRLFGIGGLPVTASSRAEYVMPVPMGSPENYYGVFGRLRTPTGSTTQNVTLSESSAAALPTATVTPNTWTSPTNAYRSNDAGAVATSSSTSQQIWTTFGFSSPGTGTITITGIEIAVSAKAVTTTGCSLTAGVYRKSASAWSATTRSATITSTSLATYTLGGPTDLWGVASGTWSLTNDFVSVSAFRARLANTGGCTGNIAVDWFTVKVYWTRDTTVVVGDPNLTGPNGETLAPRGFWGDMNTQGSEDVNGDAYLPAYSTRTSGPNTKYDPTHYYDYALTMSAGADNGNVWIFDPGFCATSSTGDLGTGDRWFASSYTAVSAFYQVYDTQETLWDLSDDTLVASSGDLFKNQLASDSTLSGPTGSGISSCTTGAVASQTDGRYWHNKWWQLASGLDGGSEGKTYRVRTSSTDPSLANAQVNANGQNSFAIFANAQSGSVRVYGIGAMQVFTPLAPATSAEFYLAQIEALHAGKTVVISVWDPGDTGALSANLQVLIPTTAGYTPASLTWSSAKGTTNSGASSCNGKTQTGASVTSITTNTGNNSQFNGCWLTISVVIPATYTAPAPPGESEAGWWKIKYTMGGTAGQAEAFDVTTWQVTIRGNPVHLVLN